VAEQDIGRFWLCVNSTYPSLLTGGGTGRGFMKPFFPTSQKVSSVPLPLLEKNMENLNHTITNFSKAVLLVSRI
jgi:hypothetical protein